MTKDVTADILEQLAPGGRLRAALNYGNTVLVQRGEKGGEPRGVSPALARELARRLNVPLQFVPFEQAGLVVDALKADPRAFDIMYLAIDPRREQDIAFTAPYVQIEGCYVVRRDSPIRSVEDVDREGVRVTAGKDSAYDLFLTRNLKKATIERAPGLAETVALFRRDNLDVLAGVKQHMQEVVAANPDLRLVPGRFMVIEQAMGTPRGRGEAGARYLRAFVEEMKASGFVADELRKSGQHDAAVAPPAA
ncbi:MAG TPA: transporter substrate-binding domain-containing protein [Pseudorhodoplanes sp.]|jgi:polar amino acid transport system substrate-binding protein|nr:transporter substrate-binding domain-containing protein [Pseudorhodoplanes sp.]